MEQPLTYLNKRDIDDWLIGYDSQKITQIAEKLYLELIELSSLKPQPKIILSERNPVKFLASFIAATAANCTVFLCNPDWVKSEWQQVFDLVQPDLIWGEIPINPHSQAGAWERGNYILIPTGGSSGKIKFTIHTWSTLMASVRGFQQYFNLEKVNSFCLLPLYHVSGLMQFMRSFTSGGNLAIASFKALESGEKYNIAPEDYFISLVPTQLQRILKNPDLTVWLSRFQTVLLGGAPPGVELLEQARKYNIRLAPTYGMTETASQIVTLKPEYFLAGNNSCGQILPHAKVTIRSETGEILGNKQTGNITIKSESMALGYYPEIFPNRDNFPTDDLGFIDESGNLHIVGRKSNKIITGGENVFPAEVESAILATNLVSDVCVIGLPDNHWGQAVTAVYVPSNLDVDFQVLQKAIEDKLTKFKRPKHWITVDRLPRNSQGKVNYEKIQEIARLWWQNQPNFPTKS